MWANEKSPRIRTKKPSNQLCEQALHDAEIDWFEQTALCFNRKDRRNFDDSDHNSQLNVFVQ
jgi:hypothetical protein